MSTKMFSVSRNDLRGGLNLTSERDDIYFQLVTICNRLISLYFYHQKATLVLCLLQWGGCNPKHAGMI